MATPSTHAALTNTGYHHSVLAKSIGGAVVGVLNIAFWWLAMTRWQTAFRHRCERRHNVTIDLAAKGFWTVREDIGWWRRLKIEWLQFAFIMGLFLAWAIALMLAVLAYQGVNL